MTFVRRCDQCGTLDSDEWLAIQFTVGEVTTQADYHSAECAAQAILTSRSSTATITSKEKNGLP